MTNRDQLAVTIDKLLMFLVKSLIVLGFTFAISGAAFANTVMTPMGGGMTVETDMTTGTTKTCTMHGNVHVCN